MKKKFLAMFAAAVLLLGVTGCSKPDNPSTPTDNTDVQEKSLVAVGLFVKKRENC